MSGADLSKTPGKPRRVPARGRQLTEPELDEMERMFLAGAGVEPVARRFRISKNRARDLREAFEIPKPAVGGARKNPLLEEAARLWAAGGCTKELGRRYGLWPQSIRAKARALGLVEVPPAPDKAPKQTRLAAVASDLDAVKPWREELRRYDRLRQLRRLTDPYLEADRGTSSPMICLV
jgi:hypothetical protein